MSESRSRQFCVILYPDNIDMMNAIDNIPFCCDNFAYIYHDIRKRLFNLILKGGFMIYCFFEQSGTFKNEFIKLGFSAKDVDIKNDFNETDYVIDLFDEILSPGDFLNSLSSDDFIFAFFPCVRFSSQMNLLARCQGNGMQNWSDLKKLSYSTNIVTESAYFYNVLCSLISFCLEKNIKLIIENPYAPDHFLYRYFPFKPSIIDKDRSLHGDWFVKPTQFFTFNFSPSNNLVFECFSSVPIKRICSCSTLERSMISPVYANYFIRAFLLGVI